MTGHPRTTLLAGADIGSTHCKALLTDLSGKVVARAQRRTPRGSDPHTHPADALIGAALDALTDCVRQAGRAPVAVGLTAMAEAGALLDPAGAHTDPRARLVRSRAGRPTRSGSAPPTARRPARSDRRPAQRQGPPGQVVLAGCRPPRPARPGRRLGGCGRPRRARPHRRTRHGRHLRPTHDGLEPPHRLLDPHLLAEAGLTEDHMPPGTAAGPPGGPRHCRRGRRHRPDSRDPGGRRRPRPSGGRVGRGGPHARAGRRLDGHGRSSRHRERRRAAHGRHSGSTACPSAAMWTAPTGSSWRGWAAPAHSSSGSATGTWGWPSCPDPSGTRSSPASSKTAPKHPDLPARHPYPDGPVLPRSRPGRPPRHSGLRPHHHLADLGRALLEGAAHHATMDDRHPGRAHRHPTGNRDTAGRDRPANTTGRRVKAAVEPLARPRVPGAGGTCAGRGRLGRRRRGGDPRPCATPRRPHAGPGHRPRLPHRAPTARFLPRCRSRTHHPDGHRRGSGTTRRPTGELMADDRPPARRHR